MASEKGKIERQSGIRGKDDLREIADVYIRAFSNPAMMESHLLKSLFKAPIYNPEHTRIVFAEGRVVSGVTMAPRTMRFDSVRIPAMTIGPVGTHDHYRKRGYAAAAMEDACRYMKDHGVLVAYLQGIEDFYHQFGFHPYMASGVIKINRKKAEKEAASGHLRSMKKSDLPAVSWIYRKVTSSRIGPAIRTKALWNWLLDSGTHTWLFRAPKVIVNGAGQVCGYITRGHTAQLGEAVVAPSEPAFRAAVGALVRLAKKLEEKEISFPVPWDDGFAMFLRQHIPAEYTFYSGSTGGALMKIIDFPALMMRLEPLFRSRWERSGLSSDKVRISISSDVGEAVFDMDAKSLAVRRSPNRAAESGSKKGPSSEKAAYQRHYIARIPSRRLCGLITGYHSVGSLRLIDGVSIPRDALDPLSVLFPAGWPFVYQGDNY